MCYAMEFISCNIYYTTDWKMTIPDNGNNKLSAYYQDNKSLNY